jgi:hypothetical protein
MLFLSADRQARATSVWSDLVGLENSICRAMLPSISVPPGAAMREKAEISSYSYSGFRLLGSREPSAEENSRGSWLDGELGPRFQLLSTWQSETQACVAV